MGIEPQRGRRHAHQIEQLERPRPGGAPLATGMAAHRLADLLADRLDRVGSDAARLFGTTHAIKICSDAVLDWR